MAKIRGGGSVRFGVRGGRARVSVQGGSIGSGGVRGDRGSGDRDSGVRPNGESWSVEGAGNNRCGWGRGSGEGRRGGGCLRGTRDGAVHRGRGRAPAVVRDKPPKRSGPHNQWSADDMINAMNAVRQGMSRRKAAIKFNVNTILTYVGSIPTSDVFKFIHGGPKNISGHRVFAGAK